MFFDEPELHEGLKFVIDEFVHLFFLFFFDAHPE